ncbi:MAG: alpha/beta hydrolase [Bacteroidetes bacterium]|nr:alpha/beta hydrolase [Bacteroidota bacterium]
MKKIFYLISFLSIVFSSCLRLDSNLYNSSKLTEYKLDNYQDETDGDFRIPASYDIPTDKIHLFSLTSGTYKIYAVYLGDIADISTDTVIMYCHGNKNHIDYYWQRAKLLANIGSKNRFGVLMIDYRGFGLSEGKCTEEGLYEDVDAALAWLKQNGLTSDRLIMQGYSLGSAPATKLTATPRSLIPSKLILESPFASAEVMVQDASVLAMPGSYLTSLEINNAEEIKNIKQPFLWIHGKADSFLSIETHGEVVFKNYSGIKGVAYRIDGANHADVPSIMGFSNYIKALEEFITH